MPESTPLRRVFFALWPDAAALDALEAAAAAATGCCGGRRMRRENMHLTLAFIGAVSPAQLDDLLNLASELRAEPFDLTLDQLGWWPRNGIVWAGSRAVPPCQRRFFDELSRDLIARGFTVDARAYFPHITLLRNGRCKGLAELGKPIGWRVDAITLVESSLQAAGSNYKVLARWPLLEAASGDEACMQ
ncbi:MAG: RNA 2',3'-cyclic phosphodiesterase [Gammaproteobacteria bacterium]|nr:RNA 2',3'-cyclic phosphodiesterase [Gammaproteobacteria bacterium]MBU3988464.1 RNA 2',3'-cyclic phosphodiesterase [Gammaproteobacteria bacterium]MBU4005335.1 RNA 2',3'-cyclic phosphodiesterase [Gammaproteobacteria bacterium]MBU4022513.1 RNA 2',3'-cyclic phosphodiesterase [Gammaproteobacteria bacterium]MBU4097821.1 RNA 2',3'-cyclic phosphodiesterase [Gammaproteobacteria bacterium]